MCGVTNGRKITVDADGQTYGCPLFALSYQEFPSSFLKERLDGMRMGDVRDAEFPKRFMVYPKSVRQTEIFHHKEKKYSSYARCGECTHISTCGVCPVSIGHIPGNRDPNRIPDFQCAFAQTAAKYRARFPVQPSLQERVLDPPYVGEDIELWKNLAESTRKRFPVD
jgi:radical SAM protein with 4Fe4S-binding SPASM domain